MRCVGILHREEAMHMVEQISLQLMFFMFIQLVLTTIIASILAITLIVVVRKNDNKNASLLGR